MFIFTASFWTAIMSVYQSGIPIKHGILSSLGFLFWKPFKFPKFSFLNNLTNEYVVFWLQNVARGLLLCEVLEFLCYVLRFRASLWILQDWKHSSDKLDKINRY